MPFYVHLIQERAIVHSLPVTQVSTLWQFPLYICAGTVGFVSWCSSLALAEPWEQQTAPPQHCWQAAGCVCTLHSSCCDKQDTAQHHRNKCQTPHIFPQEPIQCCLQDYRMIQKSNMQKNARRMFLAQPWGAERERPCSWRNSVLSTLLTKTSSRHPPIPTDSSKAYFN